MITLFYILLMTVAGSIGSVAVGGIFLFFKDSFRKRLLPCLVSYATGTLLGAAFLGMIPKALHDLEPMRVFQVLLLGILVFFVLEKIMIWRHCHHEDCKVHKSEGGLILIGDALHNFIDGVIIAAAFLVSAPFGFLTALTVISHEIPQEAGDFAILLHSGYSRKKAILYNLLSSATSLIGALLGYFFLKDMMEFIPYIMVLSASSFIYIAIADLVPGLHQYPSLRSGVMQFVLILTGIATIALMSHAH